MDADQSPERPPEQQHTNPYAMPSLILGILGLFTCVTAPIGLVLAIVALRQIGRDPYKRGIGSALGGLATSVFGTVMLVIMATVILPMFARANAESQQQRCVSQMRRVAIAMLSYQGEWDYRFPPADRWRTAIDPYIHGSDVFICPSTGSEEPGYAMNGKLGAEPHAAMKDPPFTVMIFECTPGENKAGGQELLPPKPRHLDGYGVCFGDAHVKMIKQSDARLLPWDPAKPGWGVP